jgi:hypothetical protein
MCIVQCRGISGDRFNSRLNRKTRAILVAEPSQIVCPDMRPDIALPFQYRPEFAGAACFSRQLEASCRSLPDSGPAKQNAARHLPQPLQACRPRRMACVPASSRCLNAMSGFGLAGMEQVCRGGTAGPITPASSATLPRRQRPHLIMTLLSTKRWSHRYSRIDNESTPLCQTRRMETNNKGDK